MSLRFHFRDQRGAASLRCRNCAEIAILMCEQNPLLVWFYVGFRADAKAIRYSMNILIHNRIGPNFEKIYHEHVFSYENHHSCEGAFVSLTEQWKHSIDKINVRQWLVSNLDLTKVSDSLPHQRLILKWKEQGANVGTIDLLGEGFYHELSDLNAWHNNKSVKHWTR